MLRKTKDFKDFAGFVTDSGGQVRTLPPRERSTSKNQRRRGSSAAANNQSSLTGRKHSLSSKAFNTNLILIDESSPRHHDTLDPDEV